MLRLLADENFNGDIVRGLLLRQPELDLVRVQDVGLAGADDLGILAWVNSLSVPFACASGLCAGVPLRLRFGLVCSRIVHGHIEGVMSSRSNWRRDRPPNFGEKVVANDGLRRDLWKY